VRRNNFRYRTVLAAVMILSAAGCGTQDAAGDAGSLDAAVDAGRDASKQDAGDDGDAGFHDTGPDAAADAGDGGASRDAGDAGVDAGKLCPPDCPKGEMISIPAGSFRMGCNETVDIECGDEEKPYHEVGLSAYQIGKFEVTVYEYSKCVADKGLGGCSEPSTGPGCNWGVTGREWDPINCIDLISARRYCSWAGKRLPTEAEWENAARGDDGRKFPWGNSPGVDCARAVCDDSAAGGKGCGTGGTMRTGSKPAGISPFGLMDMIGNVREWVNDYYQKDYYSVSPYQDPKGPDKPGFYGVQRGGSWSNYGSYNARTSNRLSRDIGDSEPYVGFRCAK
jgi:iron(II)-dependent oxidoreductase